jgi:hypothetical protein
VMRCPLFVELCAGTAALSLRLHAGRHARPPVSRMGAKTGYAHAILRVLGLRQGQGEGDGTRYLWCEPDAGVRLLLHAYTDRDLAQAAAKIIRSWKDEDPRALWERLRAEGPAVCPDGGMDAREVARLIMLMGHSFRKGDVGSGYQGTEHNKGRDRFLWARQSMDVDSAPTLPATIRTDARTVDPREVARLLYMAPVPTRPDGVDAWNADPKLGGDDLPVRGAVPDVAHKVIIQQGATMPLADLCGPVGDLVSDVDRLSGPREVLSPVITAQAIEVAGHHSGGAGPMERLAYKRAEPSVYAAPSAAHDKSSVAVLVDAASQRPVGVGRLNLPHVADHVLRSLCDHAPFFNHTTPPGPTIPYGSADVQLPPGTVCYIDPSYVGTTSYANNLPRLEVVKLARRWADAGAVVCISEAEPIPELVADGWHSVDITETRVGQKRTFSKQQREWLTLSTSPKWTPSVQRSMF